MNGSSGFFLGVIAAATVVMAAAQVFVIVFTSRLARRVDHLNDVYTREIRPVLADIAATWAGAARVSALAAAQMERFDKLSADLVQRIEETVSLIQDVVLVPAREGRAVFTAVAAAIAAFREFRSGATKRGAPLDEEDPLFIG